MGRDGNDARMNEWTHEMDGRMDWRTEWMNRQIDKADRQIDR